MKDVNKDKLQARENFSDLEEDKEKGDRKYIYIFFYFFCQESMERKGVGYSWMSDQGRRFEMLHLSSYWTGSRV